MVGCGHDIEGNGIKSGIHQPLMVLDWSLKNGGKASHTVRCWPRLFSIRAARDFIRIRRGACLRRSKVEERPRFRSSASGWTKMENSVSHFRSRLIVQAGDVAEHGFVAPEGRKGLRGSAKAPESRTQPLARIATQCWNKGASWNGRFPESVDWVKMSVSCWLVSVPVPRTISQICPGKVTRCVISVSNSIFEAADN